MSASDPLLSAADDILAKAFQDTRAAIEGASTDILNSRPGGDDTNSIAVLVTHSLHSTRSWLSVAVGAPLPERDRPSEFMTQVPGAAALLALLDDFGAQCRTLLKPSRDIDWSLHRATHTRNRPDAPEQETAAWALVHALEHLREHVGQMTLTRQLLDRQS